MANRSDFLSPLPRGIRKMITLGRAHGFIESDNQMKHIRKMFVDAHRSHKNFKMNRKAADPTQKATPESEAGEA